MTKYFLPTLIFLILILIPVHYSSADITTGLVGHWNFDEGSGMTAVDSAGTNTGTLINNPTWITTGQIDGALSFNGTNDYVTISDNSTLEGFLSMTVATWIKSDVAQLSNNHSVVAKASSYILVFGQVAANFRGQFAVHDGTTWHTSGASANTVADNSWVHFVGVYDGTNLKVYENGVESSSNNVGSFTIASNPNDVGIGANGSGGDKFSGLIDDVRIYNRALTQVEITELYNYSGAPAPPTTCTSFTYSSWTPSMCPVNEIQTRTVLTSSPSGCLPAQTGTGGTPEILTQSCIYIPPTPTVPGTYYISPDHPNRSDDNLGTSSNAPWATFAQAIPKLAPGSTLYLMDGTYNSSNSGYPDIDCNSSAKNGTATQRITIKAENERKAFLQGDGSPYYPFQMDYCSYWIIEGLYMELGDFDREPPNTGNVFAVTDSSNLIIRRNLARFNNRYQDGAIFQIYRSSDSLIEENEIYSYHRHGFSGSRSSNLVFRRNYANSRSYADISGGHPSVNSISRADSGFLFYPGSNNIVENSISEGNAVGFRVLARNGTADDNRFYGNISLKELIGGFVTAGGITEERTPHRILFENFASINSERGLDLRSVKENYCNNCTLMGGDDRGLNVVQSGGIDESGNGPFSFFSENLLTINNSERGIYIKPEIQSWIIDSVNSFNNLYDYFPLVSNNYLNKQSNDPQLGSCLVYIPDSSPMKGAGLNGEDIGANILYRYQDGMLTNEPLWDLVTGAFPCGAIIPDVNDIPGSSCFDVHERLNVNVSSCPYPSGYGDTSPTLTADLNSDNTVNSLDWSILNASWGTSNTTADINNDGTVNSLDWSIMNSNWS